MRLELDEVRHLATLARVGMTPQELEKMRDEMSNILDSVEVLAEVDTEGVEPTGHLADLSSVMRDDEARESAQRADVLANVPRLQDDMVRVRVVME